MIDALVGESEGLAVDGAAGNGAADGVMYAARSRSAWRLTETEALVAADVALGHAPRMIALHRGVSVHTVRTQLKRVLAKSGCHRQVELAVRIREL